MADVTAALSPDVIAYLESQRLGRLATVDSAGAPQNNPVGFRYNAGLGTIDIGGRDMGASRKFRNLAGNPQVAFVVDEVQFEGIDGVRFVEIRGRAEAVSGQAPADSHLAPEIIRIHPRRVLAFNIDPGHPGLQARDVAADQAAV